ncbi:PhzF family phenazine biosynthesis protein [Mycobacteroides salmoniphilum]|uniref:Trans-2,3-dihydro-3-hydroxyanthranilate isomerase n=1 Tax=Mycobacteroides salmoniphilum TaxID=404941 RepID=A0A4R8SWL4_9MYCO|nr:PhzF family phenazine biosynthesis protein [Mycobacteroides salmoniphilum]TEA06736.1 Trans-2,3-dihydro-3-hydroxyanthranilate isomerase [Mycobacteroides salmoniphilum]
MSRTRAFSQVDVFSSVPCMGNPVGVVLDADGLSDQEMQRFAHWTGLPETTFVLGPTEPDADYRLRIFTPHTELPFAGHPTLGSAHAWLENGGAPQVERQIVQQCQVGLVRVLRGPTGLSFAAPPTVRTGPIDEPELVQIAAALKIGRDLIVDHQWVDNGPGWAVIQLSSAQQVLDLNPDLTVLPDGMIGAIGAYPDGCDPRYEIRTFAPRIGVPEDPACGSMNASVAQWLTAGETLAHSYRVSQGAALGRAGILEIALDSNRAVWVGGATNTLINGTVKL